MGGHALGFTAARLSRTDFETVSEDIKNQLKLHWGSQLTGAFEDHVARIPFFHQKSTFGDLDLLLCKESFAFDEATLDQFKSWIQDTFSVADGHLVENDNTLSFGYRFCDTKTNEMKIFQVDLILAPREYFKTSLYYFGYNDLGNLLGRVAHKMGLKLGHKGLNYISRDGNRVIGELCITKDMDAALLFLGWDPSRVSKGFETLEDIYQFVSSGSYFNPKIYQLDQVSHHARVRDRKRPTYAGFLNWLDEHAFEHQTFFHWPDRPLNDEPDNPELQKIRASFLQKAQIQFPQFSIDLRALYEKDAMVRTVKKKFNGTCIGEWTGLKGHDLSLFMSDLRQNMGETYENIKNHMDSHTESEWQDWVKQQSVLWKNRTVSRDLESTSRKKRASS